tara:strand:- start:12247 stop:13152 length:906 start_codon:yes stop_codon:yes gene_type:complete
MLTFPIKNLFIEGPDCSGKTTLVKEIHRSTNYKWHIHDRSQVSRKIFAKMYNRDLPYIDNDYHLEVSDLNNRFLFLVPSFDIVKSRFETRGDDIHKDISDIKKVYDAFKNMQDTLSYFPNVTFLSGDSSLWDLSEMIDCLNNSEISSIDDVSRQVFQFVKNAENESYPMQFTLYDDGTFESATKDDIFHKPEAEYYEKIYNKLHEKINNELDGKNEHKVRQDISSRRFVYTDDSCISFIQLAFRNGLMDFHVVIRSSDTENIFPYDLRFLYYLASTCYDRLNAKGYAVRLRFNLNSAHIIS